MSARRLLDEPLDGARLVEAGAGSGKTYTIAALYARLVAEQGLLPANILVTTFTEAAAGELKVRIRDRLRATRQWFEGVVAPGDDADELFGILERVDTDVALQRLKAALRDFDEAAIFTIHGFCLRMLQDLAFESGASFDAELSTDADGLLRAAMRDYWRERVYPESALFLAYLDAANKDLNMLRPLAMARVNHPDADLAAPGPEPDAGDAATRLEAAFQDAAARWARAEVRDQVRGLLETPDAKDTYYSAAKLGALFAEMSRLMAGGVAGALGLFKNFKCFTAEFVTPGQGLKKSAEPVRHPFFEACSALRDAARELGETFAARLARLRHDFARGLPERLERLKAKDNVLAFDDLIGRMDQALQGAGAKRMLREVRARFRAAFIDEFQDTDPRQYRIFRTLFAAPGLSLRLIGDPKQAIYGFRGADVFAYLRAKQDIADRSPLTRNWRSEPGLVQGVNQVFGARPEPFLFRGLDFTPATPAERERDVLVERDGDGGQLRVWLLADEGGDKDNKGRVEERLYGAVAQEVTRLLELAAQGRLRLGDRALEPGDMAVLTQTHAQAARVREALEKRRVPCVILKCGNVFHTREARELLRILEALEAPRENSVLSALATDILGVGPSGVCGLRENPLELERWMELFTACGEDWPRRGVMAAAGRLFNETGTRPRLLGLPGGERKLTDLLHLLELVHGREQETRGGPSEVTAWLSASMGGEERGDTPEAHQLRLDKDDAAVKVATIHASKGLEYPVVFAPFLLFGPRDETELALFHARGGHAGEGVQGREPTMVLDPNPDKDGPNLDAQRRETLAEALRLAYVALTRAKNRCYTAWGAYSHGKKLGLASALNYLFCPEVAAQGATVARDLEAVAKDLDVAEAAARIRGWAEAGGRAIDVAPLPEAGETPYVPPVAAMEELAHRCFTARVDRSWRVSSFTALSSGAPAQAWEGGGLDEAVAEDRQAVREPEPLSLFAFPKGARPGIALHAFMENLDFSLAATDVGADADAVAALARDTLAGHGFDPAYGPALADMARKVCASDLTPGSAAGPTRLMDVAPGERLDELPFTVPLAEINVAALAEVYARHEAEVGADVARRVAELQFEPQRGFLTGFMDLVFRRGGRWFLLDWKSNHLGVEPEDYAAGPLRRAMVEHCYFLQYHIYAAALDAYLGWRMPDYSHARHFGGAVYVFLRGVDPERPGSGVFFDLPGEAFMKDLAAVLTGRAGE